jgi:hypothetical protein
VDIMKYLVNGTLRVTESREDFLARVKNRPLSDHAWELIRTGVITEHGFKTGQRPGFVFVIEGDSEDAVRSLIAPFPLVREGWFDIDVDPVSPFLSSLQ